MSAEKRILNFLVICECLEEEEEELLLKPKRKRIWVKEWLKDRPRFTHTKLLKELEYSAPDDFKNFLRMDTESYDNLLEAVTPLIIKQNIVMRDPISPHERLSATLRFLASGQSYEDLKFLTRISARSLCDVVIETCCAIIKAMKNYIKFPQTEDDWRAVARGFHKRWNFPNCIGAMDGKHVNIRKPSGTGSYYFNYKKSFSIVLFAIVDADYNFIMVEAGANGRVSDGGILANSKFFEKMMGHSLQIPQSNILPGTNTELPLVFVGDDAFPLQENIMKPFSRENLSDEETIFNYRLSRARRIVENAFGILSSRFRVLLTTINLHPDKAKVIVLACCYLHNFLRQRNESHYLHRESIDIEETESGLIQSGSWRLNDPQMTALNCVQTRNSSTNAKNIRLEFCRYFNSVGAVSWQNLYLKRK